jgi:hypothetical protein
MSAERIWANSAAAGLLLLAALLIFVNLDGDRPKITVYEKARP